MPKPAPLPGPAAARRTLAHRFTGMADRLRQLNTKFGLRSQRVFLVWTQWSGVERGEGVEQVIAEVELLPTPRISDLTATARRGYSAGVFPEGSLRVDQISAGAYTYDMLTGRFIPGNTTESYDPNDGTAVNQQGSERGTNPTIDFWWELQEDGRGDHPASRFRYRVFGTPSRREGSVYWAVNLERADEERSRTGEPQIGVNQSHLMPGGE